MIASIKRVRVITYIQGKYEPYDGLSVNNAWFMLAIAFRVFTPNCFFSMSWKLYSLVVPMVVVLELDDELELLLSLSDSETFAMLLLLFRARFLSFAANLDILVKSN